MESDDEGMPSLICQSVRILIDDLKPKIVNCVVDLKKPPLDDHGCLGGYGFESLLCSRFATYFA